MTTYSINCQWRNLFFCLDSEYSHSLLRMLDPVAFFEGRSLFDDNHTDQFDAVMDAAIHLCNTKQEQFLEMLANKVRTYLRDTHKIEPASEDVAAYSWQFTLPDPDPELERLLYRSKDQFDLVKDAYMWHYEEHRKAIREDKDMPAQVLYYFPASKVIDTLMFFEYQITESITE